MRNASPVNPKLRTGATIFCEGSALAPDLTLPDMRFRPTAAIIALLLTSRALVGCAQQPDLAGAAALDALVEGRYEEARASLRARLSDPDTTGRFAVGYLETYRATGQYEEGIDEAERLLGEEGWRFAGDSVWVGPQATAGRAAHLHYARGRLLTELGRYADADAAHREAARLKRNYWRNAVELAALLIETGQAREAFQINAAIFSAFKQGYFRTSEQLAVAGRAAAFVREFHDANAAFRTANEVDPRNTENLYWWAELFREKYNDADARQTYEDALRVNSHASWLLVGLAKSHRSYASREALAEQALEANPRSVGALSVLSGVRLLDSDDEQAEALARRALAVNPQSIEALAQLASVQHVRGDTTAYRETAAAALAVNPAAGSFFVLVADNLALRFRYPDAVSVSREAWRVAPRDPAALAALGTNLMRAGRFDEARRYLETAFERDEFNVFVGNTLTLLDDFEEFSTLQSEHFTLRIHASEAEVLGPKMLEQAEAAFADMSPRYGYTPSGRILIEAYSDQDDFAVRIAGVPHLGLLGVCFGDVIALNTPRALGDDPYNWARTLRHELAHTMAIGVSNYRVPRWFTEGLSVYEEKRVRRDWARELELELFAAMGRDKLHDLPRMDRGFTRPEFPGQVLLSYYHASKIIEYLVDTYGFESITGVLRRLRSGDAIDEAIENETGTAIALLDGRIEDALERRRDEVEDRLGGLPDVLAPDNADAAVGRANGGARENDRLSEALRAAHQATRAGDADQGIRLFNRAIEIFPDYVGPGNAYDALAAIYRERNDRTALEQTLRSYLAVFDHGAAESRELASLLIETRPLEAADFLERSVEIDPYDRDARSQLAELYLELNRFDEAVKERQAVVALDPVDRAEAEFQLARALFAADELTAAKRATLRALEIAPGHREAQKLLLACVERESSAPGM